MTDLPVLIFPHTHINGTDLKKLFPFFGPIAMCLPWFVEAPGPSAEEGDFPPVTVLYPRESVRPKNDFKRLLSEYQLWIQQNQDKGYASSLNFSTNMDPSEEPPWKIRQLIQNTGKNISDPDEHKAFKWHVILHLARQLEQNHSEADKLLDQVRLQKSPVDEALEEHSVSGNLLADLPGFEDYFSTHEHHLSQLIEAWIGLFGHYLTDYRFLVTFNPNVMDYLTGLTHPAEVRLSLPDMSGLSLKDLQEAKEHPGCGSFGKALKSLIQVVENQPGPQRDEIQKLLKKIESSLVPEPTSGHMNVTLRHIPRIPDDNGTLPAILSGKILILLDHN